MESPAFSSPSPLNLRRPAKRSKLTSQRRPHFIANVTRRMAEDTTQYPPHPVLEILRHRLNTASKPGRRKDHRKVALCIEGGGMRGAVSAGMAAAIKYVGLEDAFDVVYGSSAGAIVGAYFTARQVPMYGAQIYYDIICSIPENGQRFIDLWALRHHPYFQIKRNKRRQYYNEGTRPVMLLDRLIDEVMREQQPLDWDAFWKMHAVQPMKPVASSLLEMRAHKLDSFSTFDELLECLRASARVPGIAGNPVEINGDLYTDGLMFEPIPYRSAVEDGCTDALVLRSRTDSGAPKLIRPGIYEKHIARPYFQMLPSSSCCSKVSDYLLDGHHIFRYNDDVKRLQTENLNPKHFSDTAILSITPLPYIPEVGQLESRARHVYEGVRNGFAAAYNALSPFAMTIPEISSYTGQKNRKREDVHSLNPGMQAAKWVFPDDELLRVEARHRSLTKARKARKVGKVRKERPVPKKVISVVEEKKPSQRLWRLRRNGNRTHRISSRSPIPTPRTTTGDQNYAT